MHGEVSSGSIVIDVLSRKREKQKEKVHTEKYHEYLNWSEGNGHGGREFKKVKELESTYEDYS